jgi:hypothetical protein
LVLLIHSVNKEQRQVRVADDMPRHATRKELAQAAVTVTTENQQSSAGA